MKLIDRLDNYLCDKEYRIIIKDNEINIVNYNEIIDFSLNKITIRYKDKLISIEGNNLFITKMMDNEVLISGNISNIRIS